VDGNNADPHQPSGFSDTAALPTGLQQLCVQLNAIFRADPHATPPVWQERNPWGGFTFRAYWLNSSAPEPTPAHRYHSESAGAVTP
jgi:hypothetical protein